VQNKKVIDVITLFKDVLGDKIEEFKLPPPSFELMRCEIVEYDAHEQLMIVKMPVLEDWQNPFGGMQGGLINGAVDNAVGPLSLLVAGANMTRYMETKFIKAITMEIAFIYVKAKLVEQKKRRLSFEVTVEDGFGEIYVQSKVVNFLIV
jgi:acyl-coenzyme A thioesterase PaaI-like protein